MNGFLYTYILMETTSLQNIEIYKSILENSSVEIYSKCVEIILEYMKQSIDKIYIRRQCYYKYVICKGIDTISHVFIMLLLYTRNLEVAHYHCRKSFFYYIEFMGQIGNDNHSFLQLSSKDATMFVYKKTIFEINNEYRKEFQLCEEDTYTINNMELLIDMYNKSLKCIINNYDFDSTDKHLILKEIELNVTKCFQNILSLLSKCENEYNVKLNIINDFYKRLISKTDELNISIMPYIENLSRKLKNNRIYNNNIQKHLSCEDHDNKLNTLTPLKYINWLIQS